MDYGAVQSSIGTLASFHIDVQDDRWQRVEVYFHVCSEDKEAKVLADRKLSSRSEFEQAVAEILAMAGEQPVFAKVSEVPYKPLSPEEISETLFEPGVSKVTFKVFSTANGSSYEAEFETNGLHKVRLYPEAFAQEQENEDNPPDSSDCDVRDPKPIIQRRIRTRQDVNAAVEEYRKLLKGGAFQAGRCSNSAGRWIGSAFVPSNGVTGRK